MVGVKAAVRGMKIDDDLRVVRVVDRGDEEYEIIGPRGRVSRHVLTQQHEQGLFSTYLAGVDVGLEIDPRLPGRAHGLRSGARGPYHDQRESSALVRVAEGRKVDVLGQAGEGLGERDDFYVGARFAKVTPLGARH